MHIHAVFHVEFEGLGSIAHWIRTNGHQLSETHLYRGHRLPQATDFDRLIIMGGPMNIYEEDRYPWLRDEKVFIREAIHRNRTVVGICLGAQLIADVLGARVFAGPHKEIGWFPITMTDQARNHPLFSFLPERFTVFHWHGDTFPCPEGALRLAFSEGCENQGFLYGDRVLGLQFHLESTPESVDLITDHCRDEILPAGYIQPAELIRSQGPAHYPVINQAMAGILDRLP